MRLGVHGHDDLGVRRFGHALGSLDSDSRNRRWRTEPYPYPILRRSDPLY